jgi:DNA mismatch repair protein MutS
LRQEHEAPISEMNPPMTFHSILSEKDGDNDAKEGTTGIPDFFVDLNLDQIVDAITADKEEYDLRPFFNAPLTSVDAIKYRQDVMRDLEDAGVHDAIGSFAQRMREMRQYLDRANRLTYKYNSQGWFLSSVEAYCDAVAGLASGLAGRPLRSRGLAAFFEYLKGYAASAPFMSLAAETKKLRADLSAARYALVIEHDLFTVRKYEGETDYGEEMERVFEKFRHGTAKDYRVAFTDGPGVNHIQAAALDLVARLYPETFQGLEDYCAKHRIFLDKTITRFDREVQFYAAYLELVAKLRGAGLHFCYPAVSDESKEISSLEGFDLALAVKLTREKSYVVCNDLFLEGTERIFVVNGPNQGGKTTFARAFGQLHYLASLGYPVPGKEARLFLFDRLFTHFAREEDLDNFRSKLEDDLVRIRSILDRCTSSSIVVVNEEFSSSTVQDATFLGKTILERIIRLDALCVYVTFVDELASLEKTVSLLSTVDPENPEVRTYKIERRPPDGLAHALAIAKKHRLSYEDVKERIRP